MSDTDGRDAEKNSSLDEREVKTEEVSQVPEASGPDGDDDVTPKKDDERDDCTPDDEDPDVADGNCCYRFIARRKRFRNFVFRWPRTWALLLGVIIPMLLLLSLSI